MLEDSTVTPSGQTDPSHSPKHVAGRWAAALASGDLDSVMNSYSPVATLHASAEVILGPGNIRRYWDGFVRLNGAEASVSGGANGLVTLTWPSAGETGEAETSRLRIRHGKVTEQWVGDVHSSIGALAAVPIEMSVSGTVPSSDREVVLDAIDKMLEILDEPVLHVRVRLERSSDHSRVLPVSLRASIDLKGDAVRAHVTAENTRAAAVALEHRLRERLRRRGERRAARQHRGASSGAGEWRHGDATAARTPYFPRPVDERQVVRFKTFAPTISTVEEAMFDLDSMDYDFYLFVELDTNTDAFVSRGNHESASGDGARVQYLRGVSSGEGSAIEGVEVDLSRAPVLSLGAAQDRLDRGDSARIFFEDADSGRGHVLYRRYDGHYGLIVPAD